MNDTNTPAKTLELEWHQLELRYSLLRTHTAAETRRTMLSIHEYGLLAPISVIASGIVNRTWIVIDGYLRIAAMKELGRDLITATVWDVAISDALLQSYQSNESRPWKQLEEAHLLQELMILHQYNQAQLAKRLGKSESWVCHRLQLLQNLPDFAQTAINRGVLSTWVGSRILIPFARANLEHTKLLVNYLSAKNHSSRDIFAFYEHYLRSNHHVRKQIAANPSLFFKSHELTKLEAKESSDKFAPEQVWESKTAQIITCIHTLNSILPAVFYPQQNVKQQLGLIKPFDQLLSDMNSLNQTLRRIVHAKSTHETNSTATAQNGE